jgi:actin-related protein
MLTRSFFSYCSPLTYGWEGGVALSKTETFTKKMCVTKAEYEEHGKNICKERFDS